MRLENLTPSHVRRAVRLYLEHAWPADSGGRPPLTEDVLDGADTMEETLARLEPEPGGKKDAMRRYTLRLGNERYPFMKFVVQEYLVRREFFFSVDTHDRLDIKPDNPDYEQWEDLKAFNRELARRIERSWNEAGLPTNRDLRALVEELAKVERGAEKRERLLLVDDERHVCIGLAALLKARGYQVELAHDGHEALERLAQDPVPDLVLLDYEMPGLDGDEVLRRARADPRLETLPVLMATAARIDDLSSVPRVAGLLRKPYPRDVLFEMIARILRGRHDTAGSP